MNDLKDLGFKDYKQDIMKCFGTYNEKDRICQLCTCVQTEVVNACMERQDKIHKEFIELNNIKNNCPHRGEAWDEYTRFTSCNKNGNGIGRDADSCDVKLECQKYNITKEK